MTGIPDAERWIWIELIGFDNASGDYGVSEFIEKVGFVPEGICLLASSPDIVLQHPGMAMEAPLPADICARQGHTHNQERRRQDWTNHQVRGLVQSLRAAGVSTFLSHFTQYHGNRHHREWVSDHPEVLTQRNSTEATGGYNPLKRLSSGEYFEDVFVGKLLETVADYGFDGWHGPDGNGPLSGPIFETDFSDDMLHQFVALSGSALPDEIWRAGGETCDGRRARGEWIWRHQRREWIEFWSERWAGFWRKILDRLHGAGKRGIINNAWARAPWESLYRYGVDYRKIAEAGVDAIIVETVAASLNMDPRPSTRDPGRSYDMASMLQLIRAYVPRTKLLFLCTVQDIVEQWDAIRHTPTVLEREIFSVSNVYAIDSNGRPTRSVDGGLVCLGDGIRRSEWETLERWWDVAANDVPQRVLGAAMLWSDHAVRAQVDDFTLNRTWNSHRILSGLQEHGAPIHTTVRSEHLDGYEGPLFVPNPHLLSDPERQALTGYAGGPVVVVGPDLTGLSELSSVFSQGAARRPLQCAVWGMTMPRITADVQDEDQHLPEDVGGLIDLPGYWEHLTSAPVSASFLRACADVVLAATGFITVEEPTRAVTAVVLQMEEDVLRVALRNKMDWYARPHVDLHRPIESIAVKTEFPVITIQPEGTGFDLRVPGKGLTVVDVQLSRKG
ncbi:hypothetical protein ACFL6X_05040 [Candidatus Latescibacterota bacterium]